MAELFDADRDSDGDFSSIERFEVCQVLIAKHEDLGRRIRALIPESYVQYCRALLTEGHLEENNDLVLFEGHWEDEFPF